jgi:hypothetical protein
MVPAARVTTGENLKVHEPNAAAPAIWIAAVDVTTVTVPIALAPEASAKEGIVVTPYLLKSVVVSQTERTPPLSFNHSLMDNFKAAVEEIDFAHLERVI